MYFFGHVFTHMLRILICIVWFYTMDRRYGVLKLWYEKLTLRYREMNVFVQIPAIVIMFPINLLVAVAFTYIVIPVVVMLAVLNWVLKDTYILKNISCPICVVQSTIFRKMFEDSNFLPIFKHSNIIFLYMLLTLQDVSSAIMYSILMITEIAFNPDRLPFYHTAFTIIIINLLYRILHIVRARQHFQAFYILLFRISPLILSLWAYGDVMLDIVQTNKYKNLSSNASTYSISPYYFRFALLSFIMPVILCFSLIVYNYNGFRVLELCLGNRMRNSNPLTKCFYLTIEIIIGIPSYLILSIIFYYIVIPIVKFKHGLDTIRKGEDENRSIDLDPCKIVSKYSKFNGILELYGFTDIRSKFIPLLSGFEQIGEASIQTTLSLIFISNNYYEMNYKNNLQADSFLGIPFPISILSLIFSMGSLFLGFYGLSIIICHSIKKAYQRFLSIDI